MLYAIMGTDRANSLADRFAVRPEHLQRLQELQAQGRLILAGPHPPIDSPDPGEAGFSGSLIIAEFASLDEAQAWAEEDPYYQTGVFQAVSVKPFNKVLP